MRKLIPYGRQEITDQDVSAVINTLKSDFLTQGPAVERFEKALADFVGARYAIAVSNGTAGLHIAYLAAGLGRGDAVIVPAITFAATANAALYCGATPVFADVDPNTGNIDIQSAERAIKISLEKGLNPKIIAPVHFAGRPCEMDSIVDLAKRYQLTIIEDACHALGAEYRLSEKNTFTKVGSAGWTSMAVFSFHPVKHVTTGEGGVVTTNDQRIAESLKLLRSHGITKESTQYQNHERAFEDGTANPWYHEMQALGLNYRLCDIQAALGESQMLRAAGIIARRREIAQAYDKAFQGSKHIQPAAGDSATGRHSYHLYPIRVNYSALKTTRAKFILGLKESGVGSQVHYIPVCWHPYYENNRHLWLSDSISGAKTFYEHELSIPMYPTMTSSDLDVVITAITQYG